MHPLRYNAPAASHSLLEQAEPLRIERPIEREDEIFAAGFELARFEVSQAWSTIQLIAPPLPGRVTPSNTHDDACSRGLGPKSAGA